MKTILGIGLLSLVLGAPAATAQEAAMAQTPKAGDTSTRADAYYFFTMGHLQEMQFEVTGRSELATQAADSYKKALELEPNSPVILERLAEIYGKSQHIRDAVIQAQEALKIDPDNVSAHRLLAQIYVHTLGDVNAGEVQTENLAKAIEQFQAILKVDPRDVNSALWLARLYRFENQHGEAEKVLRDLLQRDPENGAALEQLSQLLIDQGRSQEAITLLTQVADSSSSPDVYDLLGDAYTQSKDYPKAEEAYRNAVNMDPDEPAHHHGLAQTLVSENKSAEALEQYKKLSELEPGTPDNFLHMAQLYRSLGKLDQAESSLSRAKQLAPTNLEVHYTEALLDEDRGHYDDAVKVLLDAIQGMKAQPGDPGNPNTLAILYEQLGDAYSMQGNYSAAIQTFQDMGKLGPDTQKQAQKLLINAYSQGRDLDSAITETNKALANSPKDPELIITLALLYGEKTDANKATELLNGLLQGNNNDQSIYLELAQVQEWSRKYAEAEQYAQKALDMARQPPEKESALFQLGAIYERQKKFDQAEQQFRKALDLKPDYARALNYYGYMLADRGIRLAEATVLIERAVAQEPANGAYLDSLGWVYYKQNKLAEAQENLQKAASRENHDPTILGHLGDVYLKLGQNDRAAETLERALAEWQKVVPADYEPDKVNEIDAQLKNLKHRVAQKISPAPAKPQ